MILYIYVGNFPAISSCIMQELLLYIPVLYGVPFVSKFSNYIFCGEDTRRVPVHSVVELEKRTFFHVGTIFALSLLHGGPAPSFLAPAVADYIIHGVQTVDVSAEDVPAREMREKIVKVGTCIA